jgi:hypothetical protein
MTAVTPIGSGGNVVSALSRLVKACSLHTDNNQAVLALLPPAVESVRDFCDARGSDAVVLSFSGDFVFVNRRLLAAPRNVYENALALGAWLAECNATELTLSRTLEPAPTLLFARGLADAQRDKARASSLARTELAGITLRNTAVRESGALSKQGESAVLHVVRLYATAAVSVDELRIEIDAGETPSAQMLKKIAQQLVSVAEQHSTLLVTLAAAPIEQTSDGRKLLSTAVLALAMARRITSDRGLLTALVQAALLEPPTNSDFVRQVELLSALGGFQPSATERAVLSADASFCREAELPTSSLSLSLSCARRFNASRAEGATLDEALAALGADAVARLLGSILGVLATGTAVELNTGEMAMITGRPKRQIDVLRPPVRLLTDAQGGMLPAPNDLDLARPTQGAPLRWVKGAATQSEKSRR